MIGPCVGISAPKLWGQRPEKRKTCRFRGSSRLKPIYAGEDEIPVENPRTSVWRQPHLAPPLVLALLTPSFRASSLWLLTKPCFNCLLYSKAFNMILTAGFLGFIGFLVFSRINKGLYVIVTFGVFRTSTGMGSQIIQAQSVSRLSLFIR
jgi:hypothetical protein